MKDVFNTDVLELIALIQKVEQAQPELNATLAGGAVCDVVIGRPVRDLDIMIEAEPDLELMAAIFGAPFTKFEHEFDYDEDEDRKSQIVAVYHSVGGGNGVGVDLIHVDNVEERIDEFPDNLSKAFITGRGLTLLPDFIEGHMNKGLVYRESAGTPRLLKLIDKFPDYTVVHV